MKKFTAIFLIILAAGCQIGKKREANYVPETPVLKSDLMTPEVLWSFGRIGGEMVSPDGQQVLYTVTYYNIKDNKPYTDIYVIPTNGGEAKDITNSAENEFNAVWRPDGNKIGYLSSKSGSVQIWEVNPDGSGARQVSHLNGDVIGFKYSPTMDHVLYVKKVRVGKDFHDEYPDLPLANAKVEDDIMYRHWDTWNDTHNHIFIAGYNPESGVAKDEKDIMAGEPYDSPDKPFGGMEQIDWNPDGKSLAYTCKKMAGKEYTLSTNTDIYIYNLETGETTDLTDGMPGYDMNPLYSPGGPTTTPGYYLAWESMDRNGYESDKTNLYVANLVKGGKFNFTSKFDKDVSNLDWSRTSGVSVFFTSDDNGTKRIYRVSVLSDLIDTVTRDSCDYSFVARGTDKLVAQRESMSQPAELYMVDIFNGQAEQLTHVNDGIMKQLTMGKVEKRMVKTTDKKDMLTWVIYPPHFDPSKKYPALLYCEGGPQVMVSQFWSYRWNFQLMAANGYIVVAPNRRGVPGFGKEWKEEISTDYGGQDIRDLLSAIDDVAKEPYVDADKLGAVGASYGGYSVDYLEGHNENKRFKVFISHDGPFNLEQMYSTTDEMWFMNWDLGGPYWDENNKTAQRSYTFSPHLYISNWNTPILIIQGGKDYRVPDGQGLGAFNSAILKGVPAKLLYFPNENHWVLKPQDGILWQREFFGWLDKYLK